MWWCWGLLEGAWNRKYSKASLELGGSWSLKNAKDVQGWGWKNSKMPLEWKRGHPLTGTNFTLFRGMGELLSSQFVSLCLVLNWALVLQSSDA